MSTQASDTGAVDSEMNDLMKKLYTKITEQLPVEKESFQLLQGTKPLPSKNSDLFRELDFVPVESLASTLTTTPSNRFTGEYDAVLRATHYPDDGAWRDAMGDYLDEWETYKQKHWDMGEDLVKLFDFWSKKYMPIDQGSRARSEFRKLHPNPHSEAQKAYRNKEYQVDGVRKWRPDKSEIRNQLNDAPQRELSFNSSETSKNVDHTWANGKLSGRYRFFSGGASGEYEKLNKKASSSSVSVEATFTHFTSLGLSPGDWFHTEQLRQAYQNPDNRNVWNSSDTNTWETFFGDDGSFERKVAEIVMYDGLEATITSHADYSSEEYEKVESQETVGFWPFVQFTSDNGHVEDVTHTEESSLEVTISSEVGLPQLWGVSVKSMDEIFG